MVGCWRLILQLLKVLVGGVLVAILLHLGKVALLWSDGSIHLGERKKKKERKDNLAQVKEKMLGRKLTLNSRQIAVSM